MVDAHQASGSNVDVASALAECREGLADNAKQAICYRYDCELDLDEVARRLSRPVTAVRQHLYRARLSLRDCVEKRLRIVEGDA